MKAYFERLESKIPNFEQVLERIQNSFSSNILNTCDSTYGYSLYFLFQEPKSHIAGVPNVYYKDYNFEVDLEGILDINNLNNYITLKEYIESSFNYEVNYDLKKGIRAINEIKLRDIINPKLRKYFINILVNLNLFYVKKRIAISKKRKEDYIEFDLPNEYSPVQDLAERLEKEGFVYNVISNVDTALYTIYIKK